MADLSNLNYVLVKDSEDSLIHHLDVTKVAYLYLVFA